ncbi:hypothetical protein C8A01DRAFT_31673 [Parachaetomium inaequale]|uniref:Uncharacterized protein n=1 Tax=Parachaetomium inaequale TaxID=2588326 RepID=A0AAN6SVW4_9PEZI|nr:hypothetical protein C8A01DRAFT_31673 [Parachaetomium inaequale]
MSFAPQFQSHGGFNFDPSTTPGQPLHANIFRPPPSPTSSSYNLAKSTGSLLSDISMPAAQHTGTAKRKRARTRESTPLDWHMNMEGAFDGREEERGREFRYTLAGQISTTPAGPLVGAENGLLEDSVYSDVDYRRALGPKTIPESPAGQMPPSITADAPSMASWSLFSFQTIGDMVGKVWEFCKKGAFRGFQAGGGQGYSVNGSTVTETTGKPWGPELDTPIQQTEDILMAQAAPSYFPQPAPTPYSPAYHDLSTPESTPRPAAKRRQVSANNDELRNWVVVDEPNNQQPTRFATEVKAAAARPSSLARPRAGYYSQTSASSHRRISAPSQRFTGGTPTLQRTGTRPSLRISHAGSPNLTPREPASFASPRASPIAGSTPSRIPIPIQQPPTQQSYNPNPFTLPDTATTKRPTLPPLKTTASRPASRPASRHTPRQSLGTTSNLNLRPTSPSKLSSSHHRRNHSSASASSTSATTTAAAASRRQSGLAKQRQQAAGDIQQATSPRLDAEARHLAQRKLAAERDADAKVDAFNARLLSMIRQGREALGTRVEVEMDEGMGMGMGMEFGGGGGMGGWEDDD